MPSLARQTLIYLPDKLERELVICRYGESILDAPISMQPDSAIQTTQIVAADWVDQRARGNASVALSVAVATAHDTTAAAEAYAEDVMLDMTLHAAGHLTICSCYHNDAPLRMRRWRAVVNAAEPVPMSANTIYSAGAAWIGIAYHLTLTHPTLI